MTGLEQVIAGTDTVMTAASPLQKRDCRELLGRAMRLEPVTIAEVASLLKVQDPELRAAISAAASTVKSHVFGRRVVLFAPLYLTNSCVNNCLYCGFRSENKGRVRKTLTVAEVVEQCRLLVEAGFRRVLLVCGQTAMSLDYLAEVVAAIYAQTGIRIVHMNLAPLDDQGFERLVTMGVGVFQLFQETYHPETYAYMHPKGPKSNYEYRLKAMNRASAAGLKDLGLGALLGLYDPCYETIALIEHARYLQEHYHTGAHTISLPRLCPAPGAVIQESPHPVDDELFKLIIAVIRLALPSVGIVITTRESAKLRRELLHHGVSQISAGSCTAPGGYGKAAALPGQAADGGLVQFAVEDIRSLVEVMGDIAQNGFLPSLCTACYRSGRTGETFHQLVLSGQMGAHCKRNALLALMEYALDHGDQNFRRLVEKTIASDPECLKDQELARGISALIAGEHDCYS